MTSTYTYLLVVQPEPQECIKAKTEQTALHLIFESETMMFNKTIITLCVVIVGAAWIEATDERMTPKESLVILKSPPVYLNPVSHLTSEKSTAPLPSSTTEDDLSHQLSKLLHNTEYLLSEEIEFIGVATTESGISKKGSSPATQTDEEFILEELISPVQSDKDEITSQQNKSSIESIFDSIIIIGSITIVILIIVLYFVIVAYFCIRKTPKLDCSKFGQHPNMVYQTTIEVDSLLGKTVK